MIVPVALLQRDREAYAYVGEYDQSNANLAASFFLSSRLLLLLWECVT